MTTSGRPAHEAHAELEARLTQSTPARDADWFKRFPTGGTVYVTPQPGSRPPTTHDVDWFRRMPNGGGTKYAPKGRELADERESAE